jgi:hypothetical protein
MAPVDTRRRVSAEQESRFRCWRRDLLTRRLMPVIGRHRPAARRLRFRFRYAPLPRPRENAAFSGMPTGCRREVSATAD